jgi:shikimate kinase
MDWNDYFVRQRSNRRLAKQIIYTQGRTPEQTCLDVVARLDRRSKGIFLIGPVGAGKTTVAKLLSDRLGRPQAAMDAIRRRYYGEIGYTQEKERAIQATDGFPGVLDYWKQFDVHAIRRALEAHRDHIVDFGAGQTVFDDEGDLARVEKLLEPFANVFLLLPAPAPDQSIVVLAERLRQRTSVDGVPLARYLVTHRSNQLLATATVYTEGKTAAAICREIRHTLCAREETRRENAQDRVL